MKSILTQFLILNVLLLLSLPLVYAESTPAINVYEEHLYNVTQLTQEGDNGEAYFSSDGQQLIYQSSRGGEKCDKIWTMNIDGSDKQRVSPEHGAHTCSFFYPDKQHIVFASTSHQAVDCPKKPEFPSHIRYAWPLYPYSIYKANVDGSKMQKLTNNPQYDAEPVISSDGKKIVFGSQREGDFDVYTMDADGSNVKRLTDKVGYDGGPWFSPDGQKIVWRAWYPQTEKEKAQWQDSMDNNYITSTPLDLWIMNADGSGKTRITNNGATNWAPSWHPDGQRIIFSSNMDDWHEDLQTYGHNFELYIIHTDGSHLKRITDNKVFDSFPMFSADAKKLVFGSNRNAAKPRATDIYISDWKE